MKNSKLRRKMHCMGILLAALLYSSATFADIVITAEVLSPTTVNASYSHTFQATGTDVAGASWTIDPVGKATLEAHGIHWLEGTHSIEGPATLATDATGIAFDIGAVNGGAQDVKTFHLVINRLGVDLVVVLDKSGSMGYAFDGTPGAPMGSRRYDGLIRGVNAMTSQLNNPANLVPDDRIGLRFFNSTATAPGAGPYTGGLVTMDATHLSDLNTAVNNESTLVGGNTALGDGIKTGNSILFGGAASNKKVMIVFSDGMQNTGDKVKTVDPGAYTETDLGSKLSQNGTATSVIHTICLGSSGDNPFLMEQIAVKNGSGGYYNSMVGDNNDFMAAAFLSVIQKILSGNSPELVDIRSGTFKTDSLKRMSLQESFTVNKSASSVYVALASGMPAQITSVKKDGVELIQYIHASSGPGLRTFYINLPIPSLPSVKPAGEWKIAAIAGGTAGLAATGGTGSTGYSISMMVEDHFNHLGFSPGGNNFKVGDALHPTVTIKRDATPYSGATVEAIVAKPGDDINDLLARADIQYTNPPGDSSTPNIGKLAELMKDSNFLAKVRANNRQVTLAYDTGTNSYKGDFQDLDVAGVYRVVYRITSNDTVNGTMNRFYMESFNVRFKDVDMANSHVAILIDSSTRNAIISIRPVSTTGKFIGPGWGSSIGLNATGLKVQRIEDLGDGTYKLHLDGPLSGNGVLTLANDTLYNGPLSDITNTGDNGGHGSLFGHWWFWLIILLILILIIWSIRKKKP